MKTVILLGAGATRAAAGKKSRSKTPPLDRDFFQIASSIDKSLSDKVTSCLESLVGEYSESLKQSLETTASYLYLKAVDNKKGSNHQIAFIELLKLLNEVLAATTNTLPTGPKTLLYRLLLSEAARLPSPNNLTVITFNYDLLIERVLEDISSRANHFEFFFPGCYRLGDVPTSRVPGQSVFLADGEEEKGVAVLKLHGSMNWQSRHKDETPTPKAMFQPERNLHVIDSPKISELQWASNGRHYFMKPIIVPPLPGKRSVMHRLIVPLWKKAALALQSADRVIVAGYSCPPSDLEARILLSENLRQNKRKRLYVIDPCASTAAKFMELCGVNHATIYDSMSKWVEDAKNY